MEVRMGRSVRALTAAALLLPIGVMLSKRLPAPAVDGQARRCEVPAEPPRPLHLDRFADRGHLRVDAATAESWAIAYADVSPLRQQGAGRYAGVGDQCVALLFATISQRHEIDVETVREYARQRDVLFDAAVLLLFAFAYVLIAQRLVGAVTRRFPGEEPFALGAAVIIVSAVTVFAAVLAGDIWSIAAEILRVGNGHLSYRTERLPWRQYRPAIVAAALGVFWVLAIVRIKAERVQGVEVTTHLRQ
jgi:hypothetical protein